MKQVYFIISAIFLLFLVSCTSKNYDAFAQCLTDNNATFYGAWWCPHCAKQKELLGSTLVNYVECSTPQKTMLRECVDAEIKTFPTWHFNDGTRLTGTQTLETLSKKTGCSLE